MDNYYNITTTVNDRQTHIQLIRAESRFKAIKSAIKNIILTEDCLENEEIVIKVIAKK